LEIVLLSDFGCQYTLPAACVLAFYYFFIELSCRTSSFQLYTSDSG